MWIDGSSTNQIFSALVERSHAESNVTSFTVLRLKLKSNYDLLDFFYLVKFVQNVPKYVPPDGNDIQIFLVDLITNRDKYGAKLNKVEWTALADYIMNTTSVQGLPATILIDLFSSRSPSSLRFLDGAASIQWGKPLTGPIIPMVTDPETWEFYNKELGLSGDSCLQGLTQQEIDRGCTNLTTMTSGLVYNDKIKDVLVGSLQAAHFLDAANATPPSSFNFPMIPFCWFDGTLNWVGGMNFSGNFRYYQNYYGFVDPDRLLKWCDAFKRALPVLGNCYSMNEDDKLFKINKVNRLGGDNGFTFVLDGYFGENGHRRVGDLGYKLFVHEPGVSPDYLGIFGKGVNIFRGKKHEVELGAGQFQSTNDFKDLDLDVRQCLLEDETQSRMATYVGDNSTSQVRVFDKYSTLNCIIETLILESQMLCNCTPWDIANYLNMTDFKVKLQLNIYG